MSKIYLKVNTTITDPNKEVVIRIRFKSGKTDQATTTGESVKLKYWNLEKQNFTKANFKGKETLLGRLRRLQDHVLDEAAKTNIYPSGWLLNVVDRYLYPESYKVVTIRCLTGWNTIFMT